MSEEKSLWSGSPSQLNNYTELDFIVSCMLFWLIIPLVVVWWKRLITKNTKYELTTERFKNSYGVLNKRTDELELHRVEDFRLEQPFLLRLISKGRLSHIVLVTSDTSSPSIVIEAIENGPQLMHSIRTCVEKRREIKGIREFDMR